MKIGIVTIHRASNYGAVLQAFALKEFLKGLNYEAELVDYRCSSIESMYKDMYGKMFSFKTKVKNTLTWSVQKKRNKKFAGFIEAELGCTEETSCYTTSQLEQCNEHYDIFVSGSDQIWNPFCTGDDKHYFLDFVKDDKKKYSYAASLGSVSEAFKVNETYKNLLNKYQEISVRENKGKDIIKEMTGRDAVVHLDPTFLLEKEVWEAKAKEANVVAKKPYLLIYSLALPKSIQDFAENYAKSNNLEVIYITLNNLFTIKNKKKCKVVTCSPIEFLSYIKQAECVVTNSFHGVAFSIIFNKKFYVEKNANPNHDNSRLENILEYMGLLERFVVNGTVNNKETEIDYSNINEKIANMRNEVIRYFEGIEEAI